MNLIYLFIFSIFHSVHYNSITKQLVHLLTWNIIIIIIIVIMLKLCNCVSSNFSRISPTSLWDFHVKKLELIKNYTSSLISHITSR